MRGDLGRRFGRDGLEMVLVGVMRDGDGHPAWHLSDGLVFCVIAGEGHTPDRGRA